MTAIYMTSCTAGLLVIRTCRFHSQLHRQGLEVGWTGWSGPPGGQGAEPDVHSGEARDFEVGGFCKGRGVQGQEVLGTEVPQRGPGAEQRIRGYFLTRCAI